MAKPFRPYEPDQMLLMPPSLADWVPEDHLARFIRDVVETLDLTAIEATYTEERGFPPDHPRMMVGVLLYAYATGTYSLRKRPPVEDVAVRFLARATSRTSGRSATSGSGTARRWRPGSPRASACVGAPGW